jgi:hypothetical protein
MQLLRTRTLLLMAMTLLVAGPQIGCAKPLTAETEHAEGVDFGQFQTYRWITDDLVMMQSGTGNENIRNVENEQRIRAAVERGLAAKGLRQASGDEADLVLAFSVGTKVRYQIQGGSTPLELVGEAASVTQGTLTLYMYSRASSEQVWSAWTKKDLEPGSDPDAVINEAVAVLLAKFPPSK